MTQAIKNGKWTNRIGLIAVAVAGIGVLSLWFVPNYFHGEWWQIATIFCIGGFFIFGIADDFFKRVLNSKYPKS